MGSGLILLLLVGAWLAVLVPMALRSHEASSALGTVDRFSDAMRVLSRRPGARAAAVVSGSPAPEQRRRFRRPARRPSPPLTPAARRRRVLVVLLVLAVVSLAAGLLGPRMLLVAHAAADLLLVGFVVWLRVQARARTRAAAPGRAGPSTGVPGRVVGVSGRVGGAAGRVVGGAAGRVVGVPARAPVDPTLRVPAARTPVDEPAAPRVRHDVPPSEPDVPPPARGAQGQPWQPVPLPVPMYVTAPVAPRRVLGLTRPADVAAARPEPAAELEHILGRRAVGD